MHQIELNHLLHSSYKTPPGASMPVEIIKRSILSGMFYIAPGVFLSTVLCYTFFMFSGSYEDKMLMGFFFFLPAGITLAVGINGLYRKKVITIDAEQVAVHYRELLFKEEWTEPFVNYKGLLYYIGASTVRNANRPILHAIVLLHENPPSRSNSTHPAAA